MTIDSLSEKSEQSSTLWYVFTMERGIKSWCQLLIEGETIIHATSPTNALSISQNNIDWRKIYRSRFGIGACFSTCPKYAHRHSSSDGGISNSYHIRWILNFNSQIFL